MHVSLTGMLSADQSIFKDRVRERDLDNFLVEEIHASEAFRIWLFDRIRGAFDAPADCTISVQKSPARLTDSRQTDVRVGWFASGGALRGCVLIESKVTADFQQGQAESYGAELAEYRKLLGLRAACAVLIAPAAKVQSIGHDNFDFAIPLEDIVASLEARRSGGGLLPELDARLLARIDMLEALCGKRSGSSWTPVTVPAKRDFAEAYIAEAAEILPGLSVRKSTDGPKALTRTFDGIERNPRLPAVTIRHEFGSGVDIKYANILFGDAANKVPDIQASRLLDETSFIAIAAAKSLAVRVETPGLDPTKPFADQRERVRTGLAAVRDLADWLQKHQATLESLFAMSQLDRRRKALPDATEPFELEFAEALREIYRESEKIGYRPTELLRMLAEYGGIETAKRLIRNPVSEGFTRLALLGRLDLTVEALVGKEQWSPLFTQDEKTLAERRLRRAR